MRTYKSNILIVDSDAEFRRSLCSSLANENYCIETCSRFYDAVKKLSESHFDCLIMDINLPEIKGYKAVSIVRSLKPGIKVILTTEKNSRILESKVRQMNVFFYYIKSFGKEELALAIRSATQQRGRSRV